MRITRVQNQAIDRPLKAPFAIAYKSVDRVRLFLFQLETDTGIEGIGAAATDEPVTGETDEACAAALAPENLAWLEGREIIAPAPLCRDLAQRLPETPAARAAVDMAIHDAWAKRLDLPLADALGRAHAEMPTSMTLGIRELEDTLAEAREFLGMGYRILKIKIGQDLEEDIARVRKIRELAGREILLRVDPNQGYTLDGLIRFSLETDSLDIEMIEQPLPVAEIEKLPALPEKLRRKIAVDENLIGEKDAIRLTGPYPAAGIYNIKLMKCGGIHPARNIAAIAEAAAIRLMWGCMIESRISLAAALHTAFACPGTRYLDLDGDWDLVEDVAEDGFTLENGVMRTSAAPGLGIGMGKAYLP
jgi:L-Ala-D/L-Glu epimerase